MAGAVKQYGLTPRFAESVQALASSNKDLAYSYTVRKIDIQDVYRRPAALGFADENWTTPMEMPLPLLLAWMKQRNHFTLNSARQIRALGQVAVLTAPCKVRAIVCAGVLLGDYVFEVKGEGFVILMDVTILTSEFSSLPHQAS